MIPVKCKTVYSKACESPRIDHIDSMIIAIILAFNIAALLATALGELKYSRTDSLAIIASRQPCNWATQLLDWTLYRSLLVARYSPNLMQTHLKGNPLRSQRCPGRPFDSSARLTTSSKVWISNFRIKSPLHEHFLCNLSTQLAFC